MASLYPNSTTEGYDHFKSDSMNDSVHVNSNAASLFTLLSSDMYNYFVIFAVVSIPLCVVGFVANIICYNILKVDKAKKQTAADFLLQALAVADNLVLTFTFLNSIIICLILTLDARQKTITSEVIKVYTEAYVFPFVCMATPASVWITVLLAMNRYIAVCRPLDAHRLASLKKTKIQVAVVFTLAIIFSLPHFFQYTLVFPQDYNSMTMPSLRETSTGPSTIFDMAYYIMQCVIKAIVPFVILIIFNSKIIWELRKTGMWRNAIQQNDRRSENNITVVMVVIIIVFIVCSITFVLQTVVFYTAGFSDGWYTIWCVSHVLHVANSSTNCVVYYVLWNNFRRACHKALVV